ncbi:DUF2399 domain-containing protein [Streptomyces radiopugnans]|nr:DUF2399 domain-containing protein [Streptomyces radiopugnans]
MNSNVIWAADTLSEACRGPTKPWPVDASWGPDLAPAMTALGVALHEEATLGLLVDDLSAGGRNA